MNTDSKGRPFAKDDPRSWWNPDYKLIKEYPGMKGRLGLEVSKEGYTKNGVIPIAFDCAMWPEFWERLI